MRFLWTIIKILLTLILVVVIGIAIYTLFFDPISEPSEVSQEFELPQ